MKKLNFVLAAAMAASLITVPAANAAEPVEIFSQNFDGCNAILDARFAWVWNADNFAIVESEGGKALQMQTAGNGTDQGQVSLKNGIKDTYGNTGYITVKYDVKPDLNGDSATTSLVLRAKENNDIQSPNFVWNQAIAKDWPSFCNIESNVWYTITDVIDLNGKTVMTTVARKDGAIVASKSAELAGELDDIMLNMWDTAGTHKTLVDNITITYSESVANKAVLWSDNFDIYTEVSNNYGGLNALTTNGQYAIPDWSNKDGASIVTKDGGKALQLNPTTLNTQTNVIRDLKSTTGRIGVDVDIVPVAGPDNKIVFSDNKWDNEVRISIGTTAEIVVKNGDQEEWNKICDVIPGQTYTVRAILDTTEKKIEAVVIDKDRKVLGKNSAAYNGDNIGYVQLAQGAWTATGVVTYDNFCITANPDALPDVTPEPAADLQVTDTVVETKTGTEDLADTVATGIKATVTNKGNANGTVEKLTWTVKVDNAGKQYEQTSDFTTVTIEPNASVVYGLIIEDLSATEAHVDVN